MSTHHGGYEFQGMNPPRVIQELNLRDAPAQRPGRCRPAPSPRRPRTRLGRLIRWVFRPSLWMVAFGAFMGPVVFLASAPDARADSTDTVFLAVLAADGFTYDHAMVAKVISNGHQVCAMLVAGVKPFDIVARLDATEPGLGRPESAQFAALANAVYCPQFGSAVTVA